MDSYILKDQKDVIRSIELDPRLVIAGTGK